jgi:hypothetical protein
MKLRLCSLLILPFIAIQAAHAARTATVISPKAVIYADQEMRTPIGYIKNGKKIPVGKIKRNQGQVVPTVVTGRIAYVKVTDLAIEGQEEDTGRQAVMNAPKVTEHTIEDFRDGKEPDPLSENNFITLKSQAVDVDQTEAITVVQDEGELKASSMGFLVEHRHPNHKYAWGVGLDYYSATTQSLKYSTMALNAQVTLIPLKLWIISPEVFAGFLGGANFNLEVANVGTYKGAMYGYHFGGQVRLFPDSKFGLVAGFSKFTMNLSGLKDIQNDFNDETVTEDTFKGSQVFGGLTYKF